MKRFTQPLRHAPWSVMTAILFVVAGLLLAPPLARASVVNADMAAQVVRGWLNLDSTPLKSAMATSVNQTDQYDAEGLPAYYVVHLDPEGLVIVSGDTLAEPIVGFLPHATTYANSTANPLGALVTSDLPHRVATARASGQTSGQATAKSGLLPGQESLFGTNPDKWNTLLGGTEKGLATGAMDDIRVDAMVESKWSQTTADGKYCYNAFTPYEFPSGCVATAMGQLMRFHQHPQAGIGANSETYFVIGNSTSNNTLGGDGSGGAYVWSDMVLVPASGATQDQCDAIGRLLYDAGMTVGMDYGPSGSSSDTLQAAVELRSTFGYASSLRGWNSGSNMPAATLQAMVNPNLDYGHPVLFGITGDGGGHAIVGDGYGYNGGTMYHHLNMGWAGYYDAWYNLPTIDSNPSFNSVYKIVYNTFVTETGELVSGRVVDENGAALSGVAVTINDGDYNATTNGNGIYALNVPSGTSLTINATMGSYAFSGITATAGTSTDGTTTVGNLWAQDFAVGGGGGGTIPATTPTGLVIAALLTCGIALARARGSHTRKRQSKR